MIRRRSKLPAQPASDTAPATGEGRAPEGGSSDLADGPESATVPDADPDTAAVPSPAPEPQTDPRAERVAAAVQAWQRHLVDLGGRNTLLWYRDLPSGTLDLTTAHPGGVAMLMAGRPTRLSDLMREPAALDEARRRARTIRAKTLELSEERGIAAGFIAIGMATWTVRGASRPPAAPVLLRSCVLKPTGAAQDDFSIDLGNDVEFNPVLDHYLRSEQGLDLDTGALEEMSTAGNGFDPYPVYAALTRLCEQVPDFSVAPRLVVGTFSYAKLPMVADLAAQGDELANHDVVAALAGDPGALKAVRSTVPDSPADADPSREHLILDADSTQQSAIDAVRSGAHLVIKGPPGTGKSQTIANLIASLAGEGKRVLFVAEKRAAIDAVLSRLERVGLADLVLDAYDGASNKRRLAQEFGAALERGTAAAEPDTSAVERALVERRARLVEHSEALHRVREPWGVSAHQVQNAIATLSARRHPPTSRIRVRGEQLTGLSRERVDELAQELTEAASLGAWSTDDGTDPWYAARISTTEDAVRAQEITGRLGQSGLQDVQKTMDEVFAEVTLPQAERVADWGVVLDTVGRVRDTLEVFRPEVFDLPLGDLVAATGTKQFRDENGVALGWVSRWRLRRQARSLLRPGTPPADLHSALVDAQHQRQAWHQMAGAGGRPEIPVDLDRARTAYDSLADDLRWLGDRLGTTAEGGDLLHTDMEALQRRMAALAGRPERLTVLPRVLGTLDSLREAGMGPLVDDLARRKVDVDDVASELEFVWWTSLAEHLTVQDPAYGAHDGDHLRRIAREYVAADHAHLTGTAERVRAAAGRRLREVLADHPEQESLVRAEAGKARRHRPLREMLPKAGRTLTAIKPAWAMSPLVVASVLPPGRWFDVVIFDEASQIPPAQAISAISRAHQVVVAGDERQLPPTSFFTAAVDEEGAAETETLTEGFESVLDVLAAALPTRRLSWHYRSLDERLIAFANSQMYDGSLVTFPGTGSDAVVRLEAVEGAGVVQPGEEAIESTEAEVERVVELVLEHARTRPQESLGVIALGIKHANRIEEALRRALSTAEGVGDFFDEDRPERFFVKNLERVQGDERDAVILSIGYGKTPHGRVLHRFGPLNLEGGERRLNVAITRARRRMTVVSSLLASDLDPSRLKARGAAMLRDFLAYAESQASVLPAPTASEDAEAAAQTEAQTATPTPQAEPVRGEFARRLREAGLVVHEAFGGSVHPIDLAVEDPRRPGHVLVAVESDGPAYAAMRSTRDRDRLRGEQLGRLGWEHVRVWSTDLFRDPARDVARVVAITHRTSEGARGGAPVGADNGSVAEQDASAQDQPQAELGTADDAELETTADEQPDERSAEAEEGTLFPEPAAEPAPEDEGRKRRGLRRKSKRAPEQTRDDTDAGWGELFDSSAHDRWLEEQRPPHWGRD
ncbi:AAA domain-containing protein [Pedococcus cremeus]|uniref:AAA domain-containing protein n=1 Tax=Pedococcus cremeus TaxID=587636 RepID=A0A1H9XJ98_9MICO|nr:AAA domain-containing protein [Pedococcus cremeus]SES45887.1 AAA domain-containing protein [Pedococcus cremeus]